MGISVAVLALSGVLLGAVSTDVAAGARLETMIGSAPVLPTEPTQAAFAAELTPLAGIELKDHRFRVMLRYSPRLFLRRPNVLGVDRPVLLHRATADERLRISRTVTFRANLSGSIGEVDYVGLSGVLPPTQLSQLNQSVIRLYDIQQTLALDLRASRRWLVSMSGFAGRGGPMSFETTALPTHTRAGAGPTIRHFLTRVDELRLPASAEYHRVGTTALAAEMGELDWDRHLSARTGTSLGGGVLASQYLDSSRSGTVLPTGSAAIRHALVDRRDLRIDGRLGVVLRGILNLLAVEYRPVAGLEAALALRSPPHWTANLRSSLYTAATSTPLRTGEPETFFSVEAPVIYTIDPNWSLETGLRSFFRAPHLSRGFDVEQLQVWGYVAVMGIFGTDPEPRTTVQ